MVLSDGWETGILRCWAGRWPDHHRAGRVVRLSPLLGSPGYEPLTKGMQAALPHVDVFAPASDLDSLAELARHLSL